MKLDKIWLVRDPSPRSTLGDVVWETDTAKGLGRYALGCQPLDWERENHTLYTTMEEAVGDALCRLAKIDPERAGWHNHEAFETFGYGAVAK